MKESDLQKSIIDYLRLKKYVVVKFSSVGIYDKRSGTYIPQSQKGVSDLLACSPEGKFFAIEVKKDKYSKPSEYQLTFIESINKNNGVAFVAYDLDIVIKHCG